MAEINVTPFADVLLVLLIIFMILAAIANPPGFQKQLPRLHANQRPPGNPWQQVKVEVTARNAISIDGRPIVFANLEQAMSESIAHHRLHHSRGYTPHVSLLADADASYDTIIKILDAARLAGDDDVGFVTR